MTTTTIADTSSWQEVAIPFSGFYETIHSILFEDALRDPLTDDMGNEYPELQERADALVFSWRVALRMYSEEYADTMRHALDIPREHWVFSTVISPREYNFVTDRIFVKIHPDVVASIVQHVLCHLHAEFVARCITECTSRPGFHSFYNPDYSTWGMPEAWNHNQLGILIDTYCTDKLDWGDDDEGFYDWQQDAAYRIEGSGALSNIVDAGYKVVGTGNYTQWQALCNDAYELRERGE